MVCEVAIDLPACEIIHHWHRGYDRSDHEGYDSQADDGAGIYAECAHKNEARRRGVECKALRHQDAAQEEENADSERAGVILLYQLRYRLRIAACRKDIERVPENYGDGSDETHKVEAIFVARQDIGQDSLVRSHFYFATLARG